MSGIKALRKIQLGSEATPGTQVPATALYRGTGTLEDTRAIEFPEQDVGVIGGLDDPLVTRYGGNLNLGPDVASFEQLPYLLEAGIKKLAAPTADGGGSGKIYNYPLALTSQPTLRAFSVEGGDDNLAEFAPWFFISEITFDGKWGESLKVSAKGSVRQVDRGAYLSASTISFDNANHILDSGNGFTTAAGFAASMTVKVIGSANNDGIYTVTARADGQLTVTETTATEAAGTPITVQKHFTGGPTGLAIPTVEFMTFSKSKLYLDTQAGTMGSTLISDTLASAKITIKTGVVEVPAGNGDLVFAFTNVSNPEVTAEIDFWANANMKARKYNWRQLSGEQVRIRVLGSALSVAGTYATKVLDINLPGRWTKFSGLQDRNGNDFVTGSFTSRYNRTAGIGPSVTVVNELASLP